MVTFLNAKLRNLDITKAGVVTEFIGPKAK